jgi:hypothetical protein
MGREWTNHVDNEDGGGWESGRHKARIHQLRGRGPDWENGAWLLDKAKGTSLGL